MNVSYWLDFFFHVAVYMLIASLYRRQRRFKEGVIDLLWVCENGNFKNGNEHGGYDEGEVLARDMITRVKRETGIVPPWDLPPKKKKRATASDEVSF